jgi:hypothetical protein
MTAVDREDAEQLLRSGGAKLLLVICNDLTEDGRDGEERRFLRRLTLLQPPFCEVWTGWPQLVVSVTVADDDENLVLRTLRVDYDGNGFVAGNDPSHQITDELDPDDPDRLESPSGLDPEELAELAMAWLRAQAARPIERQEWDEDDGGWRRWVLTDTGQALTIRRVGGVAFAASGPWAASLPRRAPDRVERLPV